MSERVAREVRWLAFSGEGEERDVERMDKGKEKKGEDKERIRTYG